MQLCLPWAYGQYSAPLSFHALEVGKLSILHVVRLNKARFLSVFLRFQLFEVSSDVPNKF